MSFFVEEGILNISLDLFLAHSIINFILFLKFRMKIRIADFVNFFHSFAHLCLINFKNEIEMDEMKDNFKVILFLFKKDFSTEELIQNLFMNSYGTSLIQINPESNFMVADLQLLDSFLHFNIQITYEINEHIIT
jgi:hypothetical protein